MSLAEKPRPQLLSSGFTGAQGSVLTRHVWVLEADLPEVWACGMCKLAGHFPWVSFMGHNRAEPRGRLVLGSSLGSGARPLRGGGQQPETGGLTPPHSRLCSRRRKSWCARQNPEGLKRKKPQDHGWGEFLKQMWKARTKKGKIGIRYIMISGFWPSEGSIPRLREGPTQGEPRTLESVWGPGRCLRLGSNSPSCMLLTPPGQCPQFILQLPGPGPPL